MSRSSPFRRVFVLLVPLVVVAGAAGEARGQRKADKKYPFANPPLEVHDRLGKAGVGKPAPFAAADRAFLTDFWAARSAKKAIPPADDAAVTAHLIASGVNDPKARTEYLKKFNDLVAAAEKAVASAKTDGEKADQLLHYLHKNVMAKGYEANQTTLSAVFDTGSYNCVSSACLYFLVGTRLGLKLQPVLIPGSAYEAGHAAFDLLIGTKRTEIEPTNPDGFDWPAKLKQPGVQVIGPQPDRKKAYDCDGFGLAGSIASNLGVAAAKADPPRPVEAVRWGLIAMVLDPTDATAAENLLAAVSNWGLALDKEKKFEDALMVYEFGRDALGKNEKLDHNYKVVWEHHLDAVFGAGKIADGLKLLPRAAAAFPADKTISDPAEWVARAANQKAKADGWDKGLSFADAALKELTGKSATIVHKWRGSARRHWSQDLLEKDDVEGSLKVLVDGLAETPGNKELLEGLGFHTQEALKLLDEKKGTAAAIEHFKKLVKAFPKVKDVGDMGYTRAAVAVDKLADDKKFAEALKAAEAYAPLAGDRALDLKGHVFDGWGRALVKDEKWEEAIQKYAEGLTAHAKSTLLRENAIATVDQWGFKAIEEKKWATAIERYKLGLKHLGDDKLLKERIEYCQEQKGKG